MQQTFMRRRNLNRTLLLMALILAGVSTITDLLSLHAQQPQAQTTVTVSSVTAAPGETKSVSVTVNSAPGVASIQGLLVFDLRVVQMVNLAFASNFSVSAFNVQSNTVRFVATLTRDRPTIQNGELFHVDGRAVGQPGQSSPLNLTMQLMGDLNFQEIPRSIVNGTFTIVAATPQPPVQTPPSKLPVADFSYEPQNPTTDDTVHFIDRSSSPNGRIVSWQWDFGDGQTANIQAPTHRYANAATFIVKLTVTDNTGAGATASISKPITIAPGTAFSGKVPVVSVFPNPASRQATFRYQLPKGTTKATLLIFNLPGAEVFEHDLSLTTNEFRWDLKDSQGRDLPNGPYLYFVLASTPDGPARSSVEVLVIQR